MPTTHQLFKNNAESTVNGTITVGAGFFNVAAGHGSRFPTPGAGTYAIVTLYEKNTGGVEINHEAVKVTAIAGDTLTVTRDFEGLVVGAGGTSGGWAYPSAPGINPSGIVYVQMRYTAYAAANNLTKDGNLEGLESTDTARTNIGLGNVDNSSDANKPVSTAQQTALNLKANLNSPALVTPNLGTPSAGNLANCTGLPASAAANTPAGNIAATNVQAAINELDSEKSATTHNHTGVYQPYRATSAVFSKADPTTVAFSKTGAGAASVKAGTKVEIAGTLVQFAADTAITMPALAAGTDYAVWVKDDATVQASSSHTAAPGAGNWRKIGGFHYAPGGNAAAQAGGDTTPTINAYSLWDLKFRPACIDPRGMALVADSFWSDIYLLGVDHLTNGTSKYNVSIADGASPPKIPTKFGGNGSAAYGSMTWWEANEVLQSWGKRSPTYDEFAALAYGTTESSSVGADQGSTVLNAAYTSKWGVVQSAGCMWVWGGEFGGGAAAAGWVVNTSGRGSTHQMENAVLFGGAWDNASASGSRASAWYLSPPLSSSVLGARGVCDHLTLD